MSVVTMLRYLPLFPFSMTCVACSQTKTGHGPDGFLSFLLRVKTS
jgi:hypothetical protein